MRRITLATKRTHHARRAGRSYASIDIILFLIIIKAEDIASSSYSRQFSLIFYKPSTWQELAVSFFVYRKKFKKSMTAMMIERTLRSNFIIHNHPL